MNPQVGQLLHQLLRNPQGLSNLVGQTGLVAASQAAQQLVSPSMGSETVAQRKARERIERRPTTAGERGKIRAQEGDQPERRRAQKLNRGLASMLLSAPLALAGFALYQGGSDAASRIQRKMESFDAAVEENQEITPDEGASPESQSITEKLTESIDVENLSDVKKRNVSKILDRIKNLESQGKSAKDPEFRNLITRVKSITGDTPGVAIEETERFEKAYPEAGKPAEKIVDTTKIEVGDLVRTKDGKNGRVVKVNEEKGYADIKVDKKQYRKKLEDLQQRDWNDLKSAVIQEYAYSPDLEVPLLKFRGGPWYAYQNVSPEIYNKFATGQGTAKTMGEKDGYKWWKGKNPSVGAAFWKYMRQDPNIPYARLNEKIDVDEFYTNFDEVSPDLPWQSPQPKTKKRRKKR